jgi:cell wall-associated NlpC family hydrolase
VIRALSGLILLLVVSLATTAGAAGSTPDDATPVPARAGARDVIEAARSYLGQPYELGAEGPEQFDCSGLVHRVFADVGLSEVVGGTRRRARGYQKWFEARALTTDEPRPGDLVMWGDGRHIGIYVGAGRAISALLGGVTEHDVHGISWALSAYLSVKWDGSETAPSPIFSEPETPVPQIEGIRATGTAHLRVSPGRDERGIGFVGARARFSVDGVAESTTGQLWLKVTKANGKAGWIYPRWLDGLPELATLEDLSPSAVDGPSAQISAARRAAVAHELAAIESGGAVAGARGESVSASAHRTGATPD